MVSPPVILSEGPAAKIRNLAVTLIREMWTIAPAVVTGVNKADFTCNLKIKVEGKQPFTELTNVPILWPKGGSALLLMAIHPNDVVLVAFSKFALGNLLTNEQVVVRNTEDEDYFNMGDVVVLGGFILENDRSNYSWPADNTIQVYANGKNFPLGSLPRYEQATIPTIPVNTEAMWWDTSLSRMYLVSNRNGIRYKVQLT